MQSTEREILPYEESKSYVSEFLKKQIISHDETNTDVPKAIIYDLSLRGTFTLNYSAESESEGLLLDRDAQFNVLFTTIYTLKNELQNLPLYQPESERSKGYENTLESLKHSFQTNFNEYQKEYKNSTVEEAHLYATKCILNNNDKEHSEHYDFDAAYDFLVDNIIQYSEHATKETLLQYLKSE